MMLYVNPKKRYGQHFLKDGNIARQISDSLTLHQNYKQVLEIGPGTGILTQYLFQATAYQTHIIEVDSEAYQYLLEKYPEKKDHIIFGDFLRLDLSVLFSEPFAIIGNFPYNISSQILFAVLENHNLVTEVVGMFQKEVALRIAAGPNSKVYGILSVLLQAYYDIEYLFTVDEHVFTPPPKVKSAVIRLKRNNVVSLDCDEKLFPKVVKQAFNQRRKTLRNALRGLNMNNELLTSDILNKRAEQLSVTDFITITNKIIV
jgi:16S rRNA (adenine1518-N6/adenine1519-N6)-dimethyltransferase